MSDTQQVTLASWPPKFRARVRVDESGCWLWVGPLDNHGYGHTGHQGKSHRRAYELANGPIPEGLLIDHLCRVRACVNPDHLEAVTKRENTLRGTSPSAQAARATHCPANHPYEGENLYITTDGNRKCRACNRLRMAQKWQDPEYREETLMHRREVDARRRAERPTLRALASAYADRPGFREEWG